VVDEVHHSTASSYRAVLEHFKNNGALKILGITATPERSDNEALGQIFESVAFDYPVLSAINDGWLVPIQQQLIDIQGLDFSHVRTTAGDLNAGDLAAVMEAERNLYGVCDATMRELGNKKAIMFCVSVKQAETACSILNRYRAGVSQWASGKTPRDERRAIMKAFSEGSYQILVNCALVDEGFDIPDASLLVDAYPTKSKLRYQQRLGRIMRPLPGIVDSVHENTLRRQAISNSAKPLATVMDFTGNAGRHKLVHAVDILGGKISERTRQLIERKLRQSGRPEKIDELVLEAERKEEEERRRAEAARKARLTGKARYTMRMINPFDAFDLLAPPQRNWERNKQLSEKQRILLRKQGIDPDQMPYNEAKTLINELFRRWKLGLCTLRQAAVLKRSGYDTRQMSRERASQLITNLKANGWK
jgi:superfamily II DNA or RNA helicase